MSVKKEGITVYSNGAVARSKNAKAIIEDKGNGEIHLFMIRVDDDPHAPSCRNTVLKNKARVTEVAFSKEGFTEICVAFINYLKETNEQRS